MTSTRNPAKDKVAFANAATTGFSRDRGEVTPASLALEACVSVLRDTGLTAADVDGICGSTPSAQYMQAALGIPDITWFANPPVPFGNQVVAAVAAIHSGMCEVVLAYHSLYRTPYSSRSAARDPFRRTGRGLGGMAAVGRFEPGPDTASGAVGYTAWAARYLHEFGAKREYFGYVAVNNRTNAADNPAAAMRDPITMDDYLGARMVRWPLSVLDMDLPVDGADAFILTTAERARDLPYPPVLVNAATLGQIDKNDEDQAPSLARNGQHVVVEALRAKSDFWIDDIDVYFPYDGFTNITLAWIENSGWCKPGEAGPFIEDNWDGGANRMLINGRIPVNPHGGGLSEGGTQGSGAFREAVHQLQGRAGPRQVAGAKRTLVTPGGFFFNSQGATLHTA